MSWLLLAQDALAAPQKLETIEDLLFWACIGLCTVISGMAAWIVAQLKTYGDERVAFAVERKGFEGVADKIRAEERKIFTNEMKDFLEKHAGERTGLVGRIKELTDEKDEIYQQSVELLERFFNRQKKNNEGGSS